MTHDALSQKLLFHDVGKIKHTRDGRQIEGMATTPATCIQYTPATPKRSQA